MGTTLSHPPPALIEISGPRNRILIPGDAGGGQHAWLFPPRSRRYRRGGPPVYRRLRSPFRYSVDEEEEEDEVGRARPRQRQRGRGRSFVRRAEMDSEGSWSTDGEMSPARGPRMRGGAGGAGMGMGMGERRMRGENMDMHDARMRSAPELHAGAGYPGAPMGRPGMPAYAAVPPAYGVDMAAPEGIMGGAPAGMANPYVYASGSGQPPMGMHMQMPQQAAQPQLRQPFRPSLRPHDANMVPGGAYTAGAMPPLSRAQTAPSTSKRLNRKQSSGKKAGPSGEEFIEGDAFLDACTCTTNCSCRKGQRVLYRSRGQDGSADGEGHKSFGEIRYVLKDDVGRDCGDHSKCRRGDDDDDDEGEGEKKRKGKRGKEFRRARSSETEGFDDEMSARMRAMMQEELARAKTSERLGLSSGSPFGNLPLNVSHAAAMQDPRLLARFGGDPYAAGRIPQPPGMGGLMGGMPHRGQRMGMGGQMRGDMAFDEDVPFSEQDYPLDDMMPPMGMGGGPRPGMGERREFMGQPRRHGRGGLRRPPPPAMGMGMDGYGRGPPVRGRGMGGRRPRNGGRRLRPDFDDDSIGMGMRGGRGPIGGHGGPSDSFDERGGNVDWEDDNDDDQDSRMQQSPLGGQNGGRGRMGRPMDRRGGGAGRQAHVEDEEDLQTGY